MPANAPSPTLATPKPQASSLRPLDRNTEGDADQSSTIGASDALKLNEVSDGRITPTLDPSSTSVTSSNPIPETPSPNITTSSLLSSATFPSQPPAPSSATTSLGFAHLPPAEVGLGGLQGEEQLKSSLQSKDRMFMLVIAQEFEAFITRLASGYSGSASQPKALAVTTSTMAALGPSVPISASATSKFQRMLVYKMAEWYGLKAVAGPEGTMVVGVLGAFNEKCLGLRLSDLVPTTGAPMPAQKFKIMQRAPASSAGSSDSALSGSSPAEARGKWKTLEEREADYAAAREKIYGKVGETESSLASAKVEGAEAPSRAAAALDDDIDPVPRRRYANNGQYDLVYPSLYHPQRGPQNSSPAPSMPDQYAQQGQVYGYQQAMTYPAFTSADINGYPVQGQMQMASGYPQKSGQQPAYAMQQPYMEGQYVMGQQAYGVPAWQQPGATYPAQMMQGQQPQHQPQQYGMVQGQQAGQWQYQPMMTQPMPMIPQGMPYPSASSYNYKQQIPQPQPQPPMPQQQRPGIYTSIAQPTPQRPHPHPHSSASSSISSRSYQDGSRPHSRGSTTSTRSATSSVRIGAMFPASQAHGYRQRGMKQQGGLNGMTSLGLGEGSGNGHKRSTRGHSPSSATTTSSHSSHRASSIIVPPPSQHQLPQRPDWAANNIPYHPSPMLPNQVLSTPSSVRSIHSGRSGQSGNSAHVKQGTVPNTVEFPPLLRSDTAAEPMQVERVKMRPMSGVWNGAAPGRGSISVSANFFASPEPTPVSLSVPGLGQGHEAMAEPSRITILPGPRSSQTPGSAVPPRSSEDPDFPRRIPGKLAPSLFDPSAPRAPLSAGLVSRPSSAAANKSTTPTSAHGLQQQQSSGNMSPEEVIEAKLAAVSIKSGVSIGPPPSRQTQSASYAKIVRRD